MNQSYPKVLYIIGAPRSGTTILAELLNEVEGFFSAGELWHLWAAYSKDVGRCGCGVPPRQCEIWTQVIYSWSQRVQSQKYNLPEQIVRLREHLFGKKRFWGRIDGKNQPAPDILLGYAGAMQELYGAIAGVTGDKVVVDTSKRPRDAAIVNLARDIDLYFLHLVRDPRGVIYSRQRSRERRLRKNQHPRPQLAKHRTLLLGSDLLFWNLMNLEAERVSKTQPIHKRLFLAYETFTANPRAALRQIGEFVQEPCDHLPFTDDYTAVLGVNHVVHGNKSRFQSGEVKIISDQAWRNELTLTERMMAQLLTFPMMRRYGYS